MDETRNRRVADSKISGYVSTGPKLSHAVFSVIDPRPYWSKKNTHKSLRDLRGYALIILQGLQIEKSSRRKL